MPRCAPESDSTRCSTDRIGRRSRTVFRLSAAGSSGSGRSGAASDRGDLALVVELYFPSVREVDADTVNVSITGAEAFAFVDDDADIFTVEDLSLAAAPVVLHLRTACRLLFKSRPCMALALRDPYAHGIRKRLARSSEPATMERHGLARGVGRAARRLSVSRGFLCRGAPPGDADRGSADNRVSRDVGPGIPLGVVPPETRWSQPRPRRDGQRHHGKADTHDCRSAGEPGERILRRGPVRGSLRTPGRGRCLRALAGRGGSSDGGGIRGRQAGLGAGPGRRGTAARRPVLPGRFLVGQEECCRGPATAIVLVVGLALAGGVVTFVVITVTVGMPGLIDQVTASLTDLHTWLRAGPCA